MCCMNMAVGGGGGRGVCKFFLEGGCKFGDSCKFSHPRQRSYQASGRNVCKFFLEGNCRFGDRCRFEHPSGGRGGGGGGGRGGDQGGYRNNQRAGSRHQQAPPIDTGRGWNQKEQRNRLYSHEETDSGQMDAQSGWGQSRWGGGGGGGGGRGGDRSKSGWGQHQDSYHYVSPEYNRQRGRFQGSSRDDFRGERRELFQPATQSTQRQLSEPADIAAQIRADMEESGVHTIWPFSCYAYTKEVSCVPDLEDVSPEELRLLAYTARVSGTSAAFLKDVENLKTKLANTKRLYANITSEEVKKMLSMMNAASQGSSLSAGSAALLGPLASTSKSGTASSSLFGTSEAPKLFQAAAPHSSQALPPLTTAQQSSNTFPPSPSAAAGNQVAMATPAPGTDATDSASSELTQEELEAYRAPSFVLGKIPEHPPPPDLC